MSGFTFFKRGECPICNGLRNDCRKSNSTGLIFCRETSANPTGYIYHKNDSHGFGLWQASTDFDAFTQQSQEERERGRREYLAARERRKQQQIQGQLSATERDTHYRAILQQLRLTDSDRKHLLERGFTPEQIKQDGYRSIERWEYVGTNYPPNLPGLLSNGVINAFSSGILCPIRNENGLIVGCQVRLNKEVDNGRYRWLTSATKKKPSGATPHLNGELPIAVFESEEYKGDSIWVAEGTAFKPSLLRYRLGVPVLGAASGRFNTSPKATKAAVEYLSNQYQSKVLTFAVDAGDVANRDGVPQRWLQQFEFFSKLGYEIRIAWWGQVTKDFGDIDELSPEQYSTIRYLSVAEFKAFCVKYGGLEKPRRINNAVPFSHEERVAEAQKRLTTLQTPAEIICDSTQKYLPNLVGRIPTSGLVGLKAPKGSGKSFQIKQIKNHLCGYSEERSITEKIEVPPEQLELIPDPRKKKEAPLTETTRTETIYHRGLGKKFLSINARIALGREQAIRWEFTWIEDADLDGKEEFGEKLGTAAIIENLDEIGLCWDSLGKVFGRDWSNTMVVIDELELGLNHLVTSSTCRDRRSFILLTIEKKLKECLDNDGLVVVADADLTDCSLDYLTAIAPGHVPFIVSHDFKGDPWEVDFYTGKRDDILTQIDDWLSDENCEPIAITLDNQLEAESLCNYLIKKYPYLKNEVGGLIRIDSKVTQTDFGKDFVKRPNQSIEKYRPKVLIYTPSLGVGCSIDIPHFVRVFGLFYGNLEPPQCRQSLARVREAVPRTVWSKARGITPENEPTSYLPEAIKQRLFNYGDSSHKLIDLALDMAKAEAGADADDKELLPKLIEVLQGMMAPDGSWNNPHLDLYCNQVARRNFSMNQLAVQLREELKEEGHRVNDCETEGSTNAGDAVKDGKEEINIREAHKTATAPDVAIEDAQRIKRKPSRTDEEEHSATKAFLKRELPEVELTPEFVYRAIYKDKRKSLNQVKLHWWVLNADAVAYEDKKEWQQKLKQFSNGVPFLPDVKTYSPKVKAIHECGVFNWIKPDDFETEYNNGSEDAQKFLKQSLKVKKLVKTALGITVTKDSRPIELAKRILDRLGLGIVMSDKRREGKQIVRYYKFDPRPIQDEFRSSVFRAQKIRFEKISQEIAKSTAQEDSQLWHHSHQSLINNSSDATPSNEISQVEKSCSTFDFVVQKPDEIDPELLETVADYLGCCVDDEMVADLRSLYPDEALRVAARRLPMEKKKQIREWVEAANKAEAEAKKQTEQVQAS